MLIPALLLLSALLGIKVLRGPRVRLRDDRRIGLLGSAPKALPAPRVDLPASYAKLKEELEKAVQAHRLRYPVMSALADKIEAIQDRRTEEEAQKARQAWKNAKPKNGS